MADNVVLNSGSGGSSVAADDIGGIHYQRVKVIQGADGTNSGDTSVTLPFPTSSVLRCDAVAESATTLLVPKFAIINLAASAELVALVASKKIRVLSLSISAGTAAANTWTFKSNGTGGTAKFIVSVPASGSFFAYCPQGLFETTAGENLYLTLGSAAQSNGGITYVEAA